MGSPYIHGGPTDYPVAKIAHVDFTYDSVLLSGLISQAETCLDRLERLASKISVYILLCASVNEYSHVGESP